MISTWMKSHAARKFMRSKLAIAALVIVLIYFIVALLVFTGLVSNEAISQRVGTQNEPGLFLQRAPEERLVDYEYYLDQASRALKKPEPEKALAELTFGRVHVAELPVDELKELVDDGQRRLAELDESENLNDEPDKLAKLDELGGVIGQIYPTPTGWNGVMRKVEVLFGTDRQGRSIFLRTIYAIKVAVQVGFVTALFSVIVGVLLGAAAAFFGGWVDHVVIWLYTTLSSVPNIVLLVLVAYMFTGTGVDGTLIPVYVAFGATFWIGTCRVVRGETLKLKELEYVQAATAAGASKMEILIRHILPNVSHLMLINFSLLFIGAIKSEVILTFLGLGVKDGASWGLMISQSGSEVITNFFWQIGAATSFMFVLVLSFNILTDTLQDAFDPKHQ